ncbi:glycoside hydrolase family 88 protein [Terrimonas sp. NA20]|uniref:Glycoside hydrolase family 88 protein n=1 Tax=Terrimonas ginsenosidimutans TaxID=2908004 RepID=A0ABS9KR72_9BACT|nr:glycoside hydrolase family 88 protein [Terrimonas ginsenosidimutans]MCG2614789.1 glycoside hydrolase family 88 protein [Terrimonas ginsenosidimutans]
MNNIFIPEAFRPDTYVSAINQRNSPHSFYSSIMRSITKCLRVAPVALLLCSASLHAQYVTGKGNDATMPLHLMKPDYVTPYGETTKEKVKQVLDRVYNYLGSVTPMEMIDKTTQQPVSNLAELNSNSVFKQGDFRLISYEWGVAYTGMLEAGEATGDKRYTDYTIKRIQFLADVVKQYRSYLGKNAGATTPVRSVLEPHALDDAGSMAAAMIKSIKAGAKKEDVSPMIENYVSYIMNKEFRLKDGTLARNRPLPNTLWLDDLYMSLPALVQMGVYKNDKKYFDEAIKQYRLFSSRMFNKEKGLYMHGWVQDMDPHPQFHWARANGWAILTKIELLDALPASYPGRKEVLDILKQHAAGLASRQDKTGFWHQLLDRNDSYLETSATAIYAYCIARAINHGWLDAKAYGPMALLAWNAVSTKVSENGQVEGTCVGTGMGFDPAFYYYRPVNNFAAHGYGPVLLAGAEMYRLLEKHPFEINDSAVQMK